MTNIKDYLPVKYTGNGLTREFTFDFKVFSDSDVEVYIENQNGIQNKLTLDQDYTVLFDDYGGSIILNLPPDNDLFVIIARNVPFEQDITYSTSTGFSAKTVEAGFDKNVAMIQQLSYDNTRSIKVPLGAEALNLSLPTPKKGKTLKWNDDETGLINSISNIDEIGAAVEQAITSSNGAIQAAQSAQAIVDNATEVIQSNVNNVNDLLNQTKEYTKKAQFFAEHAPKTLVPFCVNKGIVDDFGNSALLSLNDDKTLITAKSPFIYTLANGLSYKITQDLYFDVSSLETGKYYVFLEHDNTCLQLYRNKIYRQKMQPPSPQTFDVWLNTSVEPYKSYIYKQDNFNEINLIPLGIFIYENDEVEENT